MRAPASALPHPRLAPAPSPHAALTALLEHVAAALAQGHDIVAREHACPVRLVSAARAQRLPTRVAEVRGLRVLRIELGLSPPVNWKPVFSSLRQGQGRRQPFHVNPTRSALYPQFTDENIEVQRVGEGEVPRTGLRRGFPRVVGRADTVFAKHLTYNRNVCVPVGKTCQAPLGTLNRSHMAVFTPAI